MIIGADFPKIEFSLFGLDLVEPNAFIGDTLILAVALLFAYKTHKISGDQPFYKQLSFNSQKNLAKAGSVAILRQKPVCCLEYLPG